LLDQTEILEESPRPVFIWIVIQLEIRFFLNPHGGGGTKAKIKLYTMLNPEGHTSHGGPQENKS
jgi:hypothetical protein